MYHSSPRVTSLFSSRGMSCSDAGCAGSRCNVAHRSSSIGSTRGTATMHRTPAPTLQIIAHPLFTSGATTNFRSCGRSRPAGRRSSATGSSMRAIACKTRSPQKKAILRTKPPRVGTKPNAPAVLGLVCSAAHRCHRSMRVHAPPVSPHRRMAGARDAGGRNHLDLPFLEPERSARGRRDLDGDRLRWRGD